MTFSGQHSAAQPIIQAGRAKARPLIQTLGAYMPIDLYALSDQVEDEESFLNFLAALAADWEEERSIEVKNPSGPFSSGALGWENGSIGAVLEAAASWGEASIDGLPLYEKPINPWRRAAHIIHAGKFYE